MDQRQFYIKRLVGLPGETVSIGEDRHARINGRVWTAGRPLANVYSFDTRKPAADHHLLKDQFYSGHLLLPGRAPALLKKGSGSMTVEDKHYLVLGDNTATSFDSRYWGFCRGKISLAGRFSSIGRLTAWPPRPAVLAGASDEAAVSLLNCCRIGAVRRVKAPV